MTIAVKVNKNDFRRMENHTANFAILGFFIASLIYAFVLAVRVCVYALYSFTVPIVLYALSLNLYEVFALSPLTTV